MVRNLSRQFLVLYTNYKIGIVIMKCFVVRRNSTCPGFYLHAEIDAIFHFCIVSCTMYFGWLEWYSNTCNLDIELFISS